LPKGVRRRYLAFKIVSEGTVTEGELTKALWDAVLRLFGEYGASQTGLLLVEHSEERNYAVLRCRHKALELVRASVASITELKGKPAVLHVIGISGTLKALHKKFL